RTVEVGGDVGEFFAFFRIQRRSKDEGNLQDVQTPAHLRRNLDIIESNRFFGVLRDLIDQPLIRSRVQRGRVVGNVRLGNPPGLTSLLGQLEGGFVDVV